MGRKGEFVTGWNSLFLFFALIARKGLELLLGLGLSLAGSHSRELWELIKYRGKGREG
jgi:hypothetical protein